MQYSLFGQKPVASQDGLQGLMMKYARVNNKFLFGKVYPFNSWYIFVKTPNNAEQWYFVSLDIRIIFPYQNIAVLLEVLWLPTQKHAETTVCGRCYHHHHPYHNHNHHRDRVIHMLSPKTIMCKLVFSKFAMTITYPCLSDAYIRLWPRTEPPLVYKTFAAYFASSRYINQRCHNVSFMKLLFK